MPTPGRLGHARRLVVGFVAIAGALTLALGWLSWRFIALGEDLDRQRLTESLEAATDAATAALAAEIAESERFLRAFLATDEAEQQSLIARAEAELPTDSVVLRFTEEDLTVYPDTRLLYYPVARPRLRPGGNRPLRVSAAARLQEAADLEFRAADLDAATALLSGLTSEGDGNVRAAALLQLGRVLVKQTEIDARTAACRDRAATQVSFSTSRPKIPRCSLGEASGAKACAKLRSASSRTESLSL